MFNAITLGEAARLSGLRVDYILGFVERGEILFIGGKISRAALPLLKAEADRRRARARAEREAWLRDGKRFMAEGIARALENL
jgi:hypothetical protein